MANGDLIKLGTVYISGTKCANPTNPYYIGGNIPKYPGDTIEIRDTDADGAYKIQWREVYDTTNNKRLLICDRNILAGISYDALNKRGLIFGKEIIIDGKKYIIRVLTGGNSGYVNIDNSNEWDRFIVNTDKISGLPIPAHGDLYGSVDINGVHNQFWHWYKTNSQTQGKVRDGDDIIHIGRGADVVQACCLTSILSNWRPVLEVSNVAPTDASFIVAPINSQKSGTTVTVNWGKSTDANNDVLTYYLEFFNGSSWIACGSTTDTSKAYTIPDIDISNAQFRVRSFDGALYSNYVTSNLFSIYTNTAPIISGNANEDLGNKNMPFSITYSVNDIDTTNVLNVVEKLNGNKINSISNAPRNNTFTINITRAMLEVLPLNTQSTIQISVTDGLSTTYKTITFTRVNNGPQITNSDSDLGIVINVTQKYTCHDVEGNTFTIVEKVDDIMLKNINGVDGTEYTTDISKNIWIKLVNGSHKYTITATDSLGASTTRTFTFTKKETVIESTGLTNIISTDAAATKILLTPNWSSKENADILFEVCNNAVDAAPTWENATSPTLINKPYVFTNKVKTATKWGIDIRFKLTLKAGATDGVSLYGLGGAFE